MAMTRKRSTRRLFVLYIVLISLIAPSLGASEVEILLKFKHSLINNSGLSSWNMSTSPCSGDSTNWAGIRCSNGAIFGLILENMGLRGLIDVDSLADLPSLRILSFVNNSFDGPMPNVKRLGALRTLYLSQNSFSGEIPYDGFKGMISLKKVYLAKNEFTGEIPKSVADLPKLSELSLEGNMFAGTIPDFDQKGLAVMNLANNQLEGPIPASLSNFNASSFLGNKGLCDKPLDPCKNSRKPFLGV